MITDLPPGWAWASLTRLRREYIRADQLNAPYASTHERRADLDESRQRIAEEAAAIVAAQRAALARGAAPQIQADQHDMFAGLAPAQLAVARKPYQECKKHGTFYNSKCYHCRRRRPDRAAPRPGLMPC